MRKFKSLLAILAGVALFGACVEEDPINGGDGASISVHPSIVTIPKDGGSAAIEIEALAAWSAEADSSWVSINPKSGNSGKSQVTITVETNVGAARSSNVTVKAGNLFKILTVNQESGEHEYGLTEDDPMTCAQAYAMCKKLADQETTSKEYYVKGIITGIAEEYGTQYGNATFNITDDGKSSSPKFQFYRGLYLENKKYDDASLPNIEEGMEVMIYGTLMNYKGTPETKQGAAYLVYMKEGSTPILSVKTPEVTVSPAAGTVSFDIAIANTTGWTAVKGENADWITLSAESGSESGTLEVAYTANTGAERSATVTVSAPGCDDVILTITQAEFSEEGTLEHPYTVSEALEKIAAMDPGAEGSYDVYLTGILTGEAGIDTGFGNATFNLTEDGKADSPAIKVFRAKDYDNAAFTDENKIKDGDELLLVGRLQRYVKDEVETPEFSKGHIVLINGMDKEEYESSAVSIKAEDITGVPAEGVTDATFEVTFTNADGWTPAVTPDGEIVTAASLEGTTVTYSVAANEGALREGSITISLTNSDQEITKVVKVSQDGAKVATTVAEILEMIPSTATNSNKAQFKGNLTGATVSFASSNQAFIEDETGVLWLYKSDHGLVAGDKISGEVEGEGYYYGGLPEITGLGDNYTKETGTPIEPTAITLSELNANYEANLLHLVKLSGVTVTDGIDGNDQNGTIEQGGATITVRAQYKNLLLENNAVGDLVAIVGKYNTTNQLFFFSNDQFSKTGDVEPQVETDWELMRASFYTPDWGTDISDKATVKFLENNGLSVKVPDEVGASEWTAQVLLNHKTLKADPEKNYTLSFKVKSDKAGKFILKFSVWDPTAEGGTGADMGGVAYVDEYVNVEAGTEVEIVRENWSAYKEGKDVANRPFTWVTDFAHLSGATVTFSNIELVEAGAPVVDNGDGTLEKPFNIAGAKAYIDASGSDNVYVKGKVSKVQSAYSESYGTGIFWISDDGTGEDDVNVAFEAYSVYFLENYNWIEGNTQIALGDDVILYGKLTKYNSTYETSSKKAYLYSLNGKTEDTARVLKAAAVSESVEAAGGDVKINVKGNVSWTATATDGATLSASSGKGEKTITVSIPENTAADTKEWTVTVSTEEAAATKSFEIKLTQAAAEAPAPDGAWLKSALKDLKTGDVVVLAGKNATGLFAVSNDKGTSSAPAAVAITGASYITDPAANIQWTVEVSGGKYTFYATGDKSAWLYATNSNNGVRVGTNANKVFSISTEGYLFNDATSRYIGIYNNADWRCYTSINSNIQNQEFFAFVAPAGAAAPVFAVDGDFSEWASIDGFDGTRNSGSSNSRINRWKFKADSENIYLYFNLATSKFITDAKKPNSYFYIGFDTDNNAGTGETKTSLPGLEHYVVVYPCVKDSDPVTLLQGVDERSTLDSHSLGTIKTWGVVDAEDSAVAHIEMCIPRSTVSLTAAGTVKIGASFQEYDAAMQTLVLE